MTFVHPWLLVAAAVGAALPIALWAYDRAARARIANELGDAWVIGRVTASVSPGRRLAKAMIAAAALALIGFSLARPQLRGERRVEQHGLDLVVALDVSKSMGVGDVGATEDMAEKHVEASRLARARELASSVIDELPGDRFAPVVFAGIAAHFPLTDDREAAKQFLTALGPDDLVGGTNLTEVFRVSRCLLRQDIYNDLGCGKNGRRGHGGDPLPGESLDPPGKAGAGSGSAGSGAGSDDELVEVPRGKAIVIFTDGGDVGDEALREVHMARELGIAVIVVGIGSKAGGTVYELDGRGRRTDRPKRGADGQPVVARREDDSLRTLATEGGDAERYIVAGENGEVDPQPIVDRLLGVERGLSTKRIDDRHDVVAPFLFAALLLLVIEAAISTRRRIAHPEATS